MYHMIFTLVLLTSTSKAEEFLKCSAVGKTNEKCVKDFYPDQEAQESNFLNPYDNGHSYQDDPRGPYLPQDINNQPSAYSDQNQFFSGQEYDYGYTVNDVTTGDQKFHRETRQDNVVHGTYSLIEPDGSKRTVVYTADDINGFKAVVYRDGANLVDQEYHNVHTSDSPGYNTRPESYPTNTQPGLVDFINGKHLNYESQITETNSLGLLYQPTGAPSEPLNYPVTSHDPNVNMAALDPNFNRHQIPQNIQVLVESSLTSQPNSYGSELRDSNPEIFNEYGEILGEQSFIDSFIKGVEYDQKLNNLAVSTNLDDENDGKFNSSVLSGTPNPIIVQLNTEIVGNRNSELVSQSEDGFRNSLGVDTKEVSIMPNSIQGLANTINPTLEPSTVTTGSNILYKIVTDSPVAVHHQSNTDLQPTPYSPLDLNAYISSHFVDSSALNTTTVVESPHNIVTTPAPITTTISSQRLNTLSNGEFPLLAHVSPSYARRYARHYA